MANNIKIYSDIDKACIFFDNSTVSPKFLGTIRAIPTPNETDRITIFRLDRTEADGITFRKIFRKLKISRIQDKDGKFLTTDPSYGLDKQGVVDHLNAQFTNSLAANINIGYKGVWDAANNVPDVFTDVSGYDNGDWLWITTPGEQSGVIYAENDQIRFNSALGVSGEWERIKDVSAKVEDIEGSAINEYDIVVDASYIGSLSTGSALQPYIDLATAITNSVAGNNILVKGSHTIVSEIVLPHSLNFYGVSDAEIKYDTYVNTNGDVFSFTGTNVEEFTFENIKFKNAGGYGLYIKKTEEVNLRNCEFINNGWNGQGLNTVLAAADGNLGYDSPQGDFSGFYGGVNTSNGGAVRLEECRRPLIRECKAEGNLRGFRVQDCGIYGGGFLIENQSIGNLESGIYIAAGALGGCQNITTTINYSAYNANNGLLVIGGINNKFSQNEVYGNWNAGFCAWGSVNTTLRDCGLYDNNRSAFNGIGNNGDAKASIQINDAYSFIPYQLAYNPAMRFIVEILDTQVHYTGLGSNTDKVGFLLTSGMGNIADNDKNIIKIDDVGFIGQDYAIDLSEVDVSNLRLSLGDNSYQSIGEKAVKAPLAGNYSELPFSNHVMQVPEVDIVVDTLKQSIALHEGVGGNVINMYGINELQSIDMGGHIDIIQKGSNKIQLRKLTLGNVYVNGVAVGNSVNSMNNSVNAALNMDLTQYTDFLQTDVFDYTSEGNSPPIVETNEVIADGVNYNSSYMAMGVPDGNGESTLVASQNGDNKADVWSNVPINQMGEYSIFQTDSAGGGKRFYVGFTTDDQLGNLADGSGNGHEGMQWSVAIYDGYDAPWTFYGTQAQASYNSAWWGNNQDFRDHSGILTQKVTWKVGIEDDGKFYVYFWSLIDEEWKYLAKTNYTLVGDDYHPMVRFYTNGGGFYNGFDNFRYEETADTATFYYIESPDGVFHYPLFQTQDEANLIDETLGGTGTSHFHTYIDDPTNTTWWMPDTGGTMSGSSAPTNGDFTVGGNTITGVNWNEQTTDDDANYLPTFNSITYNVQEGSAVNIPYKPAGDTATYNITNVPNGYADDGYSIVGTAEDITNGAGNSIQHVINVTKVNSFGSVQGTITINVKADLAGNEFRIVEQSNGIVFTQDNGDTTLNFNTVTFNAGSTYKFYLDHYSVDSNDTLMVVDTDGNAYTTGVTLNGNVGDSDTFLEFIVPADVPPVNLVWTDGDATATITIPMNIAGSTYTVGITGITKEGPSANQTGTNVMDYGDNGWISLDEQLGAGERLVLDNAFFADFLAEVKGNNTIFAIGLKGDNWTNTKEVNNFTAASSGEFFKGNTYIIGSFNSSGTSVSMTIIANGVQGNSMLMNTTSLFGTACAFLEITSDGNNIRSGFGRNNSTGSITQGDESTVEYSNWNAYKGETGDQGFGISNIDVVMSFWTYDGGAIDGNEIDWTGLSEVSVPTPPTSSSTNFSKAVDFSSGTSEYVYMSDSDSRWPLLKLPSATVSAHSSAPLKTSDASGAEPFMTSCVFQPGATAPSVQGTGGTRGGRIWGCGQGVSIGHYNIMLEQHSNNDIIFSWGKVGNYNGLVSEENNLRVIENADPNKWYGVYIAHRGHRSSAPSAVDLGAMFDIYVMSSDDSFAALGSNVSTPAEWGQSWNQTGKSITDRLDISSTLHFGGINHSNGAFSGKIASFVCHPLHGDADMPNVAEVKKSIVDPIGWANDLVGTAQKNYVGGGYTFALNNYTSALSTQIYTFGDGTNDSFSGGIRNQIHPGDTSYTDLSFVNMQSDDIVNISPSGL